MDWTDHSFIAYDTDFDALAVFHSGDQRGECSLIEEIDVPDSFTRFVENFAESK